MIRRLVLVRGEGGAWLDSAHSASKKAPTSFDVLLIGTVREEYEARFAQQLARIDALFLDPKHHAAHADSRLRNELPPLMRDIAELRLANGSRLTDELDTDRGNWWWLMPAAEKSPFRGDFVRNLHVLALVRGILDASAYHEIWLDVDDSDLRSAVTNDASDRPSVGFVGAGPGSASSQSRAGWGSYWKYSVGHVVRWLSASAILGRRAAATPVSGRTLFLTVLPQWWLGAFTESAEDRFFPPLPDRIGGQPPAWFAWVNLSLRQLWRRRDQLRRMAGSGAFVWAHSHVSPRAALSLVSPWAFMRVRRFWKSCERHVAPDFCGFSIRDLVLRELHASVTGGELPRNRMLLAATQGVSVRGPAALVFRDECQPIERAVTLGCRNGTTSMGVRHIALDRNYLPFHFAESEIERALSGDSLGPPVPDVLLVIGEACARLPLRQGFPEERIYVCGPVRHGTLSAHLRKPSSKAAVRERLRVGADQPLLFVGTSVTQQESEALLELLHGAAGILGSARIVIRLHPAGKVRQSVLDRLVAAGRAVMCPDGPLYDYLGASDAMVTPGSALAFEAIALGVMPIVYEWPGGFNAHSFADFSHACFLVRDPDEMQAALRAVLGDSPAAAERRASWPALLREIYTDLRTPPSEQLAIALEAALHRQQGASA